MRQEICVLLGPKRPLGGDYRTLAGILGMRNSEVKFISERENPAGEVLTWWEPQSSATVQKFREVLVQMKRDDVVEILDREYPTGMETMKTRINLRSRSLVFFFFDIKNVCCTYPLTSSRSVWFYCIILFVRSREIIYMLM